MTMPKNLTLVTLSLLLGAIGSFAASNQEHPDAMDKAPTERYPEGDILDLLERSKIDAALSIKCPEESARMKNLQLNDVEVVQKMQKEFNWVYYSTEEELAHWWLEHRDGYNRTHFVVERKHQNVGVRSTFRNSLRKLWNPLRSNMMFVQSFEDTNGGACIRWISYDSLRGALKKFCDQDTAIRNVLCKMGTSGSMYMVRKKWDFVDFENFRDLLQFKLPSLNEPTWNNTVKISYFEMRHGTYKDSIRFNAHNHHRKWTFYQTERYAGEYSMFLIAHSKVIMSKSKAQKDLFMDMLSGVKSKNANPGKVDDEEENGSNSMHPMIMETNVFVRSKPTKEITEMRTDGAPETTDAIELN